MLVPSLDFFSILILFLVVAMVCEETIIDKNEAAKASQSLSEKSPTNPIPIMASPNTIVLIVIIKKMLKAIDDSR